MPKSKFDKIYRDLKEKIENNTYSFQEMLPSENTLVGVYNCSRNTIRRAISSLCSIGYVQVMHGIGAMVIYEKSSHTEFLLGDIETFSEATIRNNINQTTKIILFSELTVDERIHRRTGLTIGAEIYYIQRLRILDNVPLIIDHNYFLKSVTNGLTPEIAEHSIYEYIENTLGVVVTTTKRIITVEPITQNDEIYLNLEGCNCVAVVSNSTYNSDGVMFEYTQSRHCPKHFEFHEVGHRLKKI